MENTDLLRLHAMIEGRVQGVSFRGFVFNNAIQLGVTGWVRNRWEGTVEVTAEGERAKLEKLLEALYHGPPLSSVTGLSPEWQPATGEFTRFQIRSTV